MKFSPPFFLAALALVSLPTLARAEKETMPERTLAQIIEREKTLFADAARQGDKLDMEAFRVQAQDICHDYQLLLHDSPNYAMVYADYGHLLYKLGNGRDAVGMMLKADQLDPKIPLVKNQIGDYLTEEGKPLEAVNYFRAAIQLAPDEPLYHYQLGELLYMDRAEFIKSGDWSRQQVLDGSHLAFKRAAELAPDRPEFTYRYAESFCDLNPPDWDGALKAWAALEETVKTQLDRETMRLQAANVLIRAGRLPTARLLLATVTEPRLAAQKQKLVAQLAAAPAK